MEDKSKVLVSVLVAAYNMQDLLERCLQSLISQTLENIEIIVVNDGSTDNTGKICDRYAKKDGRIRVIHQSNLGLPMARKAGLDAANGKYISFVDSDDWCEADMCERLWENAVDTGADMVFCSAYRHRDDGIAKICNLPLPVGTYAVKEIYQSYILPLYGDMKTDRLITTGYVWCCLFKKEVLQGIRFFKKICLHEDEVMVLQALSQAKTVSITDDALYHYNRMGSNTMSKKNCYWEGYWENMAAVFWAKKMFACNLFSDDKEYMYRLVTWLYLKFFRSIRNETHYTNPRGFLGGLRNLYKLKDKKYLFQYKQYLCRTELTHAERLLAALIQWRLYFIPYFYYAIKCNRMRNFQEKTKN